MQKKIFEDIGKGILDNAWKGYNATLFAYGQTGSGKSWSVVGYGQNKGIVPMLANQLFAGIREGREGTTFEVKLSIQFSLFLGMSASHSVQSFVCLRLRLLFDN